MRSKRDALDVHLDRTTNAPWQDVVFVCSKCMKRQDRELRDELRQALRKRGERDVRVVACGCLDVCPDDGITIALGSELAATPAALRVIARKQAIDLLVEALVETRAMSNPSGT